MQNVEYYDAWNIAIKITMQKLLSATFNRDVQQYWRSFIFNSIFELRGKKYIGLKKKNYSTSIFKEVI